jgi:hypothetical protein
MPCFYCFHVWVPITRLTRRNMSNIWFCCVHIC